MSYVLRLVPGQLSSELLRPTSLRSSLQQKLHVLWKEAVFVRLP